MQTIEFQATIKNGIVHIPEKYKHLQENKQFRFIITDKEKIIQKWQYWSDQEIDNFGKNNNL